MLLLFADPIHCLDLYVVYIAKWIELNLFRECRERSWTVFTLVYWKQRQLMELGLLEFPNMSELAGLMVPGHIIYLVLLRTG